MSDTGRIPRIEKAVPYKWDRTNPGQSVIEVARLLLLLIHTAQEMCTHSARMHVM